MLVLNKSLQKAEILPYIRFNMVRYTLSKVILALPTEKLNATNLVKVYFNMPIRAAKSVNKNEIGIETLKL